MSEEVSLTSLIKVRLTFYIIYLKQLLQYLKKKKPLIGTETFFRQKYNFI